MVLPCYSIIAVQKALPVCLYVTVDVDAVELHVTSCDYVPLTAYTVQYFSV